jgi:hypothetical protein
MGEAMIEVPFYTDGGGSEALRAEFSQPEIEDGWVILAQGYGNGAYRDLLMYLEGPDGKLYCQESSCCSCHDISGSFDPVDTDVETMRMERLYYLKDLRDAGKAAVVEEALDKLGVKYDKEPKDQ